MGDSGSVALVVILVLVLGFAVVSGILVLPNQATGGGFSVNLPTWSQGLPWGTYTATATGTQTATATQTSTTWQTQTQTQTVASTQPGIDGATCALALPGGTDINMGASFWAQVTSNRAGREVRGTGMLLGEPSSSQVMTLGLTDVNGQLYVASPAINLPGLYEISATMIFGASTLPCVGLYIVTVHGLYIVVTPDTMPNGVLTQVNIDVYSDRPTQQITVEYRSNITPAWSSWGIVTTNQAGHGYMFTNVITGVDYYVFRAIDPVTGLPSANEEWLDVV